MSVISGTLTGQRSNGLQVILLGGLIAGTLDLSAAFIYAWLRAGVTPVWIMHLIAGGLLGPAAFNGGVKTAALGVALHYLIATTAAAVFYAASRKINFLLSQPIVSGLLFGIAVYLFMNFVVLPLSRVTRTHPPLSARIIGMLIIMMCVGLPIALIVRRFSR